MPVRLPVAVLVLALGTTCGLIAVKVSSESAAAPPSARTSPEPASRRPAVDQPGALAVLRAWDARRAEAWAVGDETGLARLYLPSSPARAADLALLRRYTARGLVVRGMRMQVLRARVLAARPRLLRLEITDRLTGAVAVGADVAARRLPVDAASTHVLTLRRVGEQWVMARVSAPLSALGAGR